jgi:hypothetical protein
MAATIAALALPRYVWAVITTKGEFAVVPVTNWAAAKRTMLAEHPPAAAGPAR